MKHLPHIIAMLLLVAWLDWPYGYYVFLRLAVTAYAVYRACAAPAKSPQQILSVAIALLYQPLCKVPLEKAVWTWINLATIPALYLLSIKARAPESQSQ